MKNMTRVALTNWWGTLAFIYLSLRGESPKHNLIFLSRMIDIGLCYYFILAVVSFYGPTQLNFEFVSYIYLIAPFVIFALVSALRNPTNRKLADYRNKWQFYAVLSLLLVSFGLVVWAVNSMRSIAEPEINQAVKKESTNIAQDLAMERQQERSEIIEVSASDAAVLNVYEHSREVADDIQTEGVDDNNHVMISSDLMLKPVEDWDNFMARVDSDLPLEPKFADLYLAKAIMEGAPREVIVRVLSRGSTLLVFMACLLLTVM